jgi:hypothetical protein
VGAGAETTFLLSALSAGAAGVIAWGWVDPTGRVR